MPRNHRGPSQPAARAVSDAAAGVASLLIVAENERADAGRLVGAHHASVKDKDPLAPVVVVGRLASPVIVASGAEAGEFIVGLRSGQTEAVIFPIPLCQGRASAPPFWALGHLRWLQAREAGSRVPP